MNSKEDEIIEIFDSDSNDTRVAESSYSNRKRNYESIEVQSSSDEEEDEENSDSENDVECIEVSESESEPEFDCDNWDNDCKVIPNGSFTSDLKGYHLMPTCLPEDTAKAAKQLKLSVEFSDTFKTPTFIDSFKEVWKSDKPIVESSTHEIITEPFKLCVLKNLLHDPSILDNVRQEFNEINWNHRNMDLYELFQSEDLKRLSEFKYINMIYEFLKTDVMNWVSDVTGLELTKISATCSYYSDTNYLLVHDDQQDDRVVAFVLYLTGKDGWKSEWGGSLQMFSRDEEDQPNVPARNVVPENNKFVFFPVTNKSYHQVEEVNCKNYCRLSINGWFHSAKLPVFETPLYKPPTMGIYSKNALLPVTTDVSIENWVRHDYLNADTVHDIQEQIEESSEISLPNYFLDDKYKKLMETLKSDEVKWKQFGPPNRRNYHVLDEDHLTGFVQEFLNLFRSREMFALLEGYTELELASKTGTMRYELSKWTPGCYSLLSDDYKWQSKSELDLIMYFGCNRKSDIVGGRVQYIGVEEEVQQALITLDPEPNTMNIIFRDTARVTRYVSKHSNLSEFYMLICSYSE